MRGRSDGQNKGFGDAKLQVAWEILCGSTQMNFVAAPCFPHGTGCQILAVFAVTGFGTETQDMWTAPYASGFHISPRGVLAIIHIGVWDSLHEFPCGQKPVPGIFQPPAGRGQILNNFQGALHHTVGMRQVTRPARQGPAVFCARYPCHDDLKMFWRKIPFIIPFQHVDEDVRFPLWVNIHGHDFETQFFVHGPHGTCAAK